MEREESVKRWSLSPNATAVDANCSPTAVYSCLSCPTIISAYIFAWMNYISMYRPS